MANNYYVEKFSEFFPEETVKFYLAFFKKNDGFLEDLFLPMTQLVLFFTEQNKLMAIKINRIGRFVEPQQIFDIRFKKIGKKKVELISTQGFYGKYELAACYQTHSKNKEYIIDQLDAGYYDF